MLKTSLIRIPVTFLWSSRPCYSVHSASANSDKIRQTTGWFKWSRCDWSKDSTDTERRASEWHVLQSVAAIELNAQGSTLTQAVRGTRPGSVWAFNAAWSRCGPICPCIERDSTFFRPSRSSLSLRREEKFWFYLIPNESGGYRKFRGEGRGGYIPKRCYIILLWSRPGIEPRVSSVTMETAETNSTSKTLCFVCVYPFLFGLKLNATLLFASIPVIGGLKWMFN